jgi:hypothetical protein
MKKSPWEFIKWTAGAVGLALTNPPTDRYAKLSVAAWGTLTGVVLLNLTMALLMPGSMSNVFMGVSLVGLAVNVVCLRWALKGLTYREAVAERAAFDRIVSGL